MRYAGCNSAGNGHTNLPTMEPGQSFGHGVERIRQFKCRQSGYRMTLWPKLLNEGPHLSHHGIQFVDALSQHRRGFDRYLRGLRLDCGEAQPYRVEGLENPVVEVMAEQFTLLQPTLMFEPML